MSWKKESLSEFRRLVGAELSIKRRGWIPYIDRFASALEYLVYHQCVRNRYFIDKQNGSFFKGYQLEDGFHHREVAFYREKYPACNVPAPQFINLIEGKHVVLLHMKYYPGEQIKTDQWLTIAGNLLGRLSAELYPSFSTTMLLSDYMDQQESTITANSVGFGPLTQLLHRSESGSIRLVYAHGDFKIDNVIVTRNGGVKLIDWENSCAAPLFVDVLKGGLDFVRRSNVLYSQRLNIAASWVRESASIVSRSICKDRPFAERDFVSNIIASVIHLVVRQVIELGNKACLRSNYRELLPLVNKVLQVSSTKNSAICLRR